MLYYTQIGTCIYIILEDKNNYIKFVYIIEQKIENDKLKIENIYTKILIDEKNVLAKFFKYNFEFELYNVKYRLLNIIDKIEVIINKKHLQEKITEYLEINEGENKEDLNISLKEELVKDEEVEQKDFSPEKADSERSLTKFLPIEVDGKSFYTLLSFAKYCSLPKTTLRDWLTKGYTPKEIVEKSKEGKADGRTKKICVNGKTYRTVREACLDLGVNYGTASGKAYKEGISIEEAVKRLSKNKTKRMVISTPIVVDGKEYKTLTDACRVYGIAENTARTRITRKGMTIEEALKTPVQDRGNRDRETQKKYIYEGEEMTIRELANLSGLSYSMISNRLKDGWTVADAVETPPIKKEDKQ